MKEPTASKVIAKVRGDVVESAGVLPVLECPAGVEARKRVNIQGDEVFMVINHERGGKQFDLPWSAHEHLTGSDVRVLKLEAYAVAVLTRIKEGA